MEDFDKLVAAYEELDATSTEDLPPKDVRAHNRQHALLRVKLQRILEFRRQYILSAIEGCGPLNQNAVEVLLRQATEMATAIEVDNSVKDAALIGGG